MGIRIAGDDTPAVEASLSCLLPAATEHISATPASGEKYTHVRTYMLHCSYACDIDKFKKLCEAEGACFLATLEVPFWNVWGWVVGSQFALIYQHHEELVMEVCT
jgi:hypothetical protein